jgi:hypothetical protein
MKKPYYTLRLLIYKKYGELRFALGCEIVARWIAFETRKPCVMEDVEQWCNMTANTTSKALIPLEVERAVMQLFGIKNPLQLITGKSVKQPIKYLKPLPKSLPT